MNTSPDRQPFSQTNPSRVLICLGTAVLGLLVMAAVAGEIQGRVTLRGAPPSEKLVDLTGFDDVSRTYPALVGELKTRHYRVSADGGLANVFIHVKQGLEGRTFPPPTDRPVLDQTNAGFYPYVLGVRTQQTVLIRNSEPYLDTVHALPRENREFNIAQPAGSEVAERRFDKPEVLIRVKCEVHPWEFAFIGVVEHPFFAVTDENGRYRLPPGLPVGKHVLEAVHPKAGRLTSEVEVAGDETRVVDFTFEAPTVKSPPKEPAPAVSASNGPVSPGRP